MANKRAAEAMDVLRQEAEEQVFIDTHRSILGTQAATFIAAMAQMARSVSEWMDHQGFWESANTPEKIALMHSELSEALEGYREGNPPDKHCAEYSSLEIELADCMVRILDFAGHHELRVGEAFVAKMFFNLSRPRMHGKNC